MASPNVGSGTNLLFGVAARAGNDVRAVGDWFDSTGAHTLVEHWDGVAWGIVATPAPSMSPNALHGVVALRAASAWAVGFAGSESLIEHWRAAWRPWRSPNPPNTIQNDLLSLSADGPSDVWAAGQWILTIGSVQLLAEHWDGTSWTLSPTAPGDGDSSFNGVAAPASNAVWAVGSQSGSGWDQTLIERYDVTAWSIVPSPDVTTTENNELESVTATSDSDSWAVGYYAVPTIAQDQTLILHYC